MNDARSLFTENDNCCLSSLLTGCCYRYNNYSAEDICGLYSVNCEEGGGEKRSADDNIKRAIEGLTFIGIRFSVNTANGNP